MIERPPDSKIFAGPRLSSAESVVLIEQHASPRSCASLLRCSRYAVRVRSVPRKGSDPPSIAPEAAVKVINQAGVAATPSAPSAGPPEEVRKALAAEAQAHAARHTVIVHARSPARAVAELIDESGGLNVLSRDSPSFAKDLLVTIEKLVGGDIFGLEKYLCFGSHIVEQELRHTDEKYVALDLLLAHARGLGLGGRAQALATAADELIMNAFFHAPILPSGARPHAGLARTTPLASPPDRPVVVRYGGDGVSFGLSVSDGHGSLDSGRIAHLLTGQLRERKRVIDLTRTSNGLGLTAIAESVSHLVFNIESGRRTEIIALVEVEGPPRMGRGTGSINVFSRPAEAGSGPAGSQAPAGPPPAGPGSSGPG